MVLGALDVNVPPRLRQRRPPGNVIAKEAPPKRAACNPNPPVRRPTSTKLAQPSSTAPAQIQHSFHPKSIGVHTLRRFQLAHQDTPEKLRALEEGWRARRRVSLSTEASAGGCVRIHGEDPPPVRLTPMSDEPKSGKSTRRTVSFAETPIQRVAEQREDEAIITAHLSSPPSAQPAMSQAVKAVTPVHKSKASAPFRPNPILAHPLPATPSPTPITSKSPETIYVPSSVSSRKYELILHLQHRDIVVKAGGEEFIIRRTTSPVTASPRTRDRILRFRDHAQWTPRERQEWEAVERLVEGTKRKTPRVKIYHPLGNICVTCSLPPDIILSFASSAVSTPSPLTKVNVTVRVTYSRVAEEARIDTSSISQPGEGNRGGSLRTRRIVPLHSSVDTPATTNRYENDGGEPRETLRAAMRDLGIASTSEWRFEEQEAVRRLWLSRKDWMVFD